LHAVLLERGLTLGDEIGVDHKTVERWVADRQPYRKHRYIVATRLKKDESYLWPGALPRDRGVDFTRVYGVLPCSISASGAPHDGLTQLRRPGRINGQ
jgi:hypothetical protein